MATCRRKLRLPIQQDTAVLLLQRDEVWTDPAVLFDGRLMFTAGGSAYVSVAGP